MEESDTQPITAGSNLTGQFLIAMPGMDDTRFERSVIYICTHSESGAMGLIINKVLDDITFKEVLSQAAKESADECTVTPMPHVWLGGPVEQGRGLVLHTNDYLLPTSMKIHSRILLTASTEILKDMASEKGPEKSLLALGYAGWGAGQLEDEIIRNSWLTCDASEDILFNPDPHKKYNQALNTIGVDPALLSSDAGHA